MNISIPEYVKNGYSNVISIEQGIQGEICFYQEPAKGSYHIQKLPKNFAVKFKFSEFVCDIPKFGKYEIEEFIAKRLATALLVTKNLNDVLDLHIRMSNNDFLINEDIVIKPELLKDRILPLFKILKKEGEYYELQYLG